jgi:hypothetical protein
MSMSETPDQISWRHVLPILVSISGMMLIGLSFVWPRMFPAQAAWSDEKAEAYQAASADLHRLSMQTGAAAPENQTRAAQEQLADAEANYAALRTELEDARSRPARIAIILRYSGILFAVVGSIWTVASRDKKQDYA